MEVIHYKLIENNKYSKQSSNVKIEGIIINNVAIVKNNYDKTTYEIITNSTYVKNMKNTFSNKEQKDFKQIGGNFFVGSKIEVNANDISQLVNVIDNDPEKAGELFKKIIVH